MTNGELGGWQWNAKHRKSINKEGFSVCVCGIWLIQKYIFMNRTGPKSTSINVEISTKSRAKMEITVKLIAIYIILKVQ